MMRQAISVIGIVAIVVSTAALLVWMRKTYPATSLHDPTVYALNRWAWLGSLALVAAAGGACGSWQRPAPSRPRARSVARILATIGFGSASAVVLVALPLWRRGAVPDLALAGLIYGACALLLAAAASSLLAARRRDDPTHAILAALASLATGGLTLVASWVVLYLE